jgi:hypothetical protein
MFFRGLHTFTVLVFRTSPLLLMFYCQNFWHPGRTQKIAVNARTYTCRSGRTAMVAHRPHRCRTTVVPNMAAAAEPHHAHKSHVPAPPAANLPSLHASLSPYTNSSIVRSSETASRRNSAIALYLRPLAHDLHLVGIRTAAGSAATRRGTDLAVAAVLGRQERTGSTGI